MSTWPKYRNFMLCDNKKKQSQDRSELSFNFLLKHTQELIDDNNGLARILLKDHNLLEKLP